MRRAIRFAVRHAGCMEQQTGQSKEQACGCVADYATIHAVVKQGPWLGK